MKKFFVALAFCFLAAFLLSAPVARASSSDDEDSEFEFYLEANETATPSPSLSPSSFPSPSHTPVPPESSPSPSASASPASASATPLPSNTTVSPTPTPTPKLKCANYTGCGNCTDQWDCVWCDSDNSCEEGGVWGPNSNPFNSCPDWRWRQCKANGKAIFWSSVCVAAVLILLFLFCCFCCCCYCRRRRRLRHIISHQKTWSQKKAEEDEMEKLLGTSRTPRTDARREQVWAKYGRPGERNVNTPRSSLFSQ